MSKGWQYWFHKTKWTWEKKDGTWMGPWAAWVFDVDLSTGITRVDPPCFGVDSLTKWYSLLEDWGFQFFLVLDDTPSLNIVDSDDKDDDEDMKGKGNAMAQGHSISLKPSGSREIKNIENHNSADQLVINLVSLDNNDIERQKGKERQGDE
ncbi:hypothetical protein C8R44DRAFT_723837 [Mycena epipterygia]|nr:hypothetical protein C8R44DRAFT_723837 [Mycena epipterygia]